MRVPVAVACLLLASTPVLAQGGPGDAAAGEALALRSCANCHLVSDRQARPAIDGVPPFAAIARKPVLTDENLRTYLQAPHPPMPDLSLTRGEIADLVAYIATLKPR